MKTEAIHEGLLLCSCWNGLFPRAGTILPSLEGKRKKQMNKKIKQTVKNLLLRFCHVKL